MDGRLLHLLGDNRGHAGGTFWSCFEPLRKAFDAHHWVVESQPWYGWPAGFHDDDGHSDTCVQDARLEAMLWKPGALSRWAAHFTEEWVMLWAPAGRDALEVAIEYGSASINRSNAYVEQHSVFWLNYTDHCCWEIFALDIAALEAVASQVSKSPDIRCYRTVSQNRRWGFSQAGWPTWPD